MQTVSHLPHTKPPYILTPLNPIIFIRAANQAGAREISNGGAESETGQ